MARRRRAGRLGVFQCVGDAASVRTWAALAPPRVAGRALGGRLAPWRSPRRTCSTSAPAWRWPARRSRPATARSASSWSTRPAGAADRPQPRRGRRRDPTPRVRRWPVVGLAVTGGPGRLHRLHLRRALRHVLSRARLDGARPDRVRRIVRTARAVARHVGAASRAGRRAADHRRRAARCRWTARRRSSRTSCGSSTARRTSAAQRVG